MYSIKSNESFESLFDELVSDIDPEIRLALNQMVEILIDQSPVDTARFVSNWYAVIDREDFTSDPTNTSGGNSALSEMIAVIQNYSISENEFIYIYNNVYSEDNQEFYAATVSYDPSQRTAQDILDAAENRFAGLI